MAGIGAESAWGADAVNQIRAAIMQRLQQAQELRLRDQDMNLRERQFQSTEELKRAQLASLDRQRQADEEARNVSAGNQVSNNLEVGDVLQPDQSQVLRRAHMGSNILHQGATLPSTMLQGTVRMPQLQGRVIQPSGAMSAEQGAASEGAATQSQQPGNPEQDVYRGNAAQRTSEDQKQLLRGYIRKLDPNSPLGQATAYEQATGRNAPAGAFGPKPPREPVPHFNVVQTYGADGKPGAVVKVNTLTGEVTPATVPGNGTIKPNVEKAPPYQAAENAAGLNTAEVEGVKILKALKQSGADQANNGFDPRWQKFVVTTLKIAPEDFQKADIQQRTAFVTAALTRQLMGGRPSQYVAQMIQQHLPQGEMSGKQLSHVLHNVLQQTTERRTELKQMLPGIKGPISGQSYEDYLTEVANGAAGDTRVGDFTVKVKK